MYKDDDGDDKDDETDNETDQHEKDEDTDSLLSKVAFRKKFILYVIWKYLFL